MSWQDDPVAPDSSPAGSSDWQNDPVVETPSKIESFVRGAANNFPFAPQVIAKGESVTGIGDEGGYSKNLADWNQKAAETKQANPKTYGTGAVLGAAAPLAIPGVGEALEAAPILGNAALGAAGAISNEDLTKNPADIAKNAVEGAVTGAGTGAVGKAIGAAGSALKPAAERIEANATAGALDLNSHGINRLAKGMKNPEKVMNVINDKLQDLFPNLVGPLETGGSKYQALLSAHEQAGQHIGSLVDAESKKLGGVIPEVDETIAKLEKEASGYEGFTSPRKIEAKAELADAAKSLSDMKKNGTLNFRNLADLKTEIGSAYQGQMAPSHGTDKAYAILSEGIDKILDRTESPADKAAFDHAKQVYKFTSDLLPAMKKGVSKEVAGIGGGVLSAGLGTAAVMGHPAAIPAYIGKQASKFVAPDLAQNLTYRGVNALKNASKVPKKLGQGLTQEVIDYINSKRKQ